jgi:hypothetical protein
MTEQVLAVAPQRFSVAGHSLGDGSRGRSPLARRSGVSKLFLSDTRARKPQDRYNDDVFRARLQLKFLADGIAGAAVLARPLQSR